MLSWLAYVALSSLLGSKPVSSTSNVFRHAQLHVRDSTDEIQLLVERRFSIIASENDVNATDIGSWVTDLEPDGQWPASEINYATGCDAQRSNWPAEDHWNRIVTMSAAWHSGLAGAEQWVGNDTLRDAIAAAVDFWFSNDFAVPACLDHGGESSCPCDTPGLWNTNWFANIIGTPSLVGEACLLLNGTLSPSEFGNCTKITSRAYNTFLTGIHNVSGITGANALDIASIGVDLGLLTENSSLLTEAFGRAHEELVIENNLRADGIRADGSFGQHTGIIYNGNYGKDFLNDVLDFEIDAGGTEFEASNDSRNALTTLLQGDVWMIFRNTLTDVLHWDFSVLGRFISLPVADLQATSDIHINLTQIEVLSEEWDSSEVKQVFKTLSSNSTRSVNVGNTEGNRMFYTNDYMVQRGHGYVTTLRMYSTRTSNTECTNSQNPFGFHLSDGTVYTYIKGNEYEDISAAWDWNLIPGITVDYNATALNCSGTGADGETAFVGGASNGKIGVAAMWYETPNSNTLNWRKTWFFLPDDVQHVMIADITSSTNAPVFSVLDQRRRSGEILVDDKRVTSGNFTAARTLFHGGVGYAFNLSTRVASLSVQSGVRTGNWSVISASTQPPASVDLFSAWLVHNDTTEPIEYTVYPSTTPMTFRKKIEKSELLTIQNDGSVSALLDCRNNIAMLVFWEASGGNAIIPSSDDETASVNVAVDGNIALIIDLNCYNITVADPTQTLTSIQLNFTLGEGAAPDGWDGCNRTEDIVVELPTGGTSGSSVFTTLF